MFLPSEDEGLEAVLIGDYTRFHQYGVRISYIDIKNMICGKVIEACPETTLIKENDKVCTPQGLIALVHNLSIVFFFNTFEIQQTWLGSPRTDMVDW